MKLSLISSLLPNDIFHTFISKLFATISLIFLIIENAEKLDPPITPKCLTLNRPHPSSSHGFNLGPSTIMDETLVPCKQSSLLVRISFGNIL